jgi:hypothetical protein
MIPQIAAHYMGLWWVRILGGWPVSPWLPLMGLAADVVNVFTIVIAPHSVDRVAERGARSER